MLPSKKTDSSCAKPKRPLTAYNLFYRYKRAKIIDDRASSGSDANKEAVCQLVATTAGLEKYPSTAQALIPPDRLDEIRRTNIHLVLEQQLLAKDTKKRPHRKSTHGFKMSFVELNTIMVDSWKKSDEFTKTVFKELAEDGKREYQQRLVEYNKELHLSAVKTFNSMSPEDESVKSRKPKPEENCHASPNAQTQDFALIKEPTRESSGFVFPREEGLSLKKRTSACSHQAYGLSRLSSPKAVISAHMPTDSFEPDTPPERQFYQQASYASPICQKPVSCPSFVTPAMRYASDKFTSHVSSLGEFPSLVPRPRPFQYVENKGFNDCNSKEWSSSDASTDSALGDHKRNVSVEDFMALIDVLSED